MTQGVMTPYPPSSPSTASLSGAARCWHSNALIFRYFLRYFSSTHRTDLSRFRGTFHSFDPVGFAIFAIPQPPSAPTGRFSDPLDNEPPLPHMRDANRSATRVPYYTYRRITQDDYDKKARELKDQQ